MGEEKWKFSHGSYLIPFNSITFSSITFNLNISSATAAPSAAAQFAVSAEEAMEGNENEIWETAEEVIGAN